MGRRQFPYGFGCTLDIAANVDITGTLVVSGAFDIGNFAFADDEELRFGDSNDFVLHYDSSAANLQLDAAAANDALDIGANTDTDVVFHGGTATYDLTWDSSEDSLILADNATLFIGTDGDFKMMSDNSTFDIWANAANGIIQIGRASNATDLLIHGASAGADCHWDSSADTLGLLDAALLGFGNTANTPDFTITYDGSDLLVEAAAANDDMKLGATTNFDLTIYGGTATNYFKFDTDDSALSLDLRNTNLIFEDGTATFTFINSSQVLLIEPDSDDRVIAFGRTNQCDVELNGNDAGRDVQWDASENTLEVLDQAIVAFGTGDDLTFSANGTTATTTLAAGSAWNISDTDNASSKVTFGVAGGTHGMDVVLQSTASGDAITFDAAGKTLTLVDCAAVFDYDDGTVSYTLTADSSDYLTLTSDDSASSRVVIGSSAGTHSTDVYLQTATAGDTIVFDGGAKTLTFTDCSTVFGYADNTVLYTTVVDSNDYLT
ncbi:MAG: hypothetical protein ACYSTJ_04995, partial [Planctomycetota bacterium]